ncbi:hypothetical protein D9M69_386990 [compost metagenome]
MHDDVVRNEPNAHALKTFAFFTTHQASDHVAWVGIDLFTSSFTAFTRFLEEVVRDNALASDLNLTFIADFRRHAFEIRCVVSNVVTNLTVTACNRYNQLTFVVKKVKATAIKLVFQ